MWTLAISELKVETSLLPQDYLRLGIRSVFSFFLMQITSSQWCEKVLWNCFGERSPARVQAPAQEGCDCGLKGREGRKRPRVNCVRVWTKRRGLTKTNCEQHSSFAQIVSRVVWAFHLMPGCSTGVSNSWPIGQLCPFLAQFIGWKKHCYSICNEVYSQFLKS